MLTASKLAKFFADRDRELFKFFRQHVPDDPAPAPEPPLKLEPPRKGETNTERLLRQARNDIRSGRSVGMATPPCRRLPRGPEQLRWNGWGWYT
jgi:hypothetical protein